MISPLDRAKATKIVMQKLLDLYAELDPWDDDEDIERDAQAIVDALLETS
jgi:hypothetical protein